MKNAKIIKFIILLLSIMLGVGCKSENEPADDLKLWYQQPANALTYDNPNGWEDDPEWLKALPLGNGSLGVMVYGDVNHERFQLSEESMWSGSPHESDNPEAFKFQEKIRELLFEGKYKEATDLANRTQVCIGDGSGHGNGANVPFGCFQTLGDLWIDNENQASYENYHRALNLMDAVVTVEYNQNDVNFKREIFTSFPDQVMVARFTADKKSSISFSCSLSRPERFKTYAENDNLVMSGTLSDGKGGNGLEYMARLKAINKNGEVVYTDSNIRIKDADEVILLLSVSTDYVLDYPSYKGRNYVDITKRNIENASKKSFADLLMRHKKEYQSYFKRVSFDITSKNVNGDSIPTNLRIQNFKEGTMDFHLYELVFQYGRYLLISSSRPGTLPANLQGIWANKIQTPWNGDYHTDINVEMNYWPAEVTNLSEMHLPFFDLLANIVGPGNKTAKIQYHNKGWVAHTITNVWGFTSPGESATWGMYPAGGAWLCQHIAEHYRFTQDTAFLVKMYPVIKDAVEFYMDWLVTDPETGKLVSGPSISPENTFIAPDGSKCQISMGPAHDQQLIWQLFDDFGMISKELRIEDNFVTEVEKAKNQLDRGLKIGSDGRLMEWAKEYREAEPGHRHISHLFSVYPASQITPARSPELSIAAKKSLDFRVAHGGGHTGWSAAWLISQYARLKEGENALRSLNGIISKNISPNLFTQHPPFQIDANFGLTAGIAEMLLQSHEGCIEFLPALPTQWKEGSVKGLKARGNYEVNIVWKEGRIVYAEIIGKEGQKGKYKINGNIKEFQIPNNGVCKIKI
ncbi:alpha-L-fucosidase [Dysgonamonadaceae bacterium]|nr:alpha-L-fucosidase [Dysgonamonadaceae bacterium]